MTSEEITKSKACQLATSTNQPLGRSHVCSILVRQTNHDRQNEQGYLVKDNQFGLLKTRFTKLLSGEINVT